MFIFKKASKKELKNITISVAIIAILFISSSYLFQNHQTDIETVIGARSLIGMTLYILVFILSIVFVPISSMPLIPIATKIWGVAITTGLSTIGWTLGAMIAFYLTRKFGRPYVSKIIDMKKVEKIIPEKNIFLTIFFLRAITPFDGLSHALGLISRVDTKTFFWATFLGLIPFCFVLSFLGSLPTVFLIIGLLLASLFFIKGIKKLK